MTPRDPYQQPLDYIYSFVDFSRTRQENLAPENFDLARVHDLLALLGDPHKTYPSIHVAGSKGKGSVSAFCASVLHAAGYRVGLYTSPHMQEFNERIQVNQQQIPAEELAGLVAKIKPAVAAVARITTFEIITALAFMHFTRQKIDIAVLEVGLGGRLDATNVITPLVSIITSLSLEHTSILGNTLAEIAGEKAGIIKENIPVIVAPQTPEAYEVIRDIAADNAAAMIQVGKPTKKQAQRDRKSGKLVKRLLLETRFEAFRLHKGDIETEVYCELFFVRNTREQAARALASCPGLGRIGEMLSEGDFRGAAIVLAEAKPAASQYKQFDA
ncbi:MAG: hypothetical protein IIC79_04590, partial [Chloroflexi bacterium]|nr:hypothetical protein [Chloroflexota bacterium]